MIMVPSWGYFVFLAAVLFLYWRLPRQGQNLWLLAASYIFYASWDWRLLGLMIGVTLLVFFACLRMKNARGAFERKAFFYGTLVLILGVLGFFKYYNFFVDSLAGLLGTWHINASGWHLEIILPLGISFYTFQLLSYVIDIERGVLEPSTSLPNFALYVAFFPKIVAGPFEKPKAFLSQVEQDRVFSKSQFTEGIDLIVWGLVKKLVVANNIGLYVNMIFDLKSPSAGLILLGGFGFGIQLFADFSGYTDMARGSAKLMGLELVRNFDRPFLARNPPDFWNRWHISLMQWVKDYIYTPLALLWTKQCPVLGYTAAILVAWAFVGLWHGAEWRYVVWGFYHAFLIILFQFVFKPVLDRVWRENSWTRAFSVVVTFFFINIGFLLFRAPSLGFIRDQFFTEMPAPHVRHFLDESWGDKGVIVSVLFVFLFYSIPLLISVAWEWWRKRKSLDLSKGLALRIFYYAMAVLLLVIFGGVDTLDFIYFKF